MSRLASAQSNAADHAILGAEVAIPDYDLSISYAKSHDVMDKDAAFQDEVINVALAVGNAVKQIRAGKLIAPDAALEKPRKK